MNAIQSRIQSFEEKLLDLQEKETSLISFSDRLMELSVSLQTDESKRKFQIQLEKVTYALEDVSKDKNETIESLNRLRSDYGFLCKQSGQNVDVILHNDHVIIDSAPVKESPSETFQFAEVDDFSASDDDSLSDGQSEHDDGPSEEVDVQSEAINNLSLSEQLPVEELTHDIDSPLDEDSEADDLTEGSLSAEESLTPEEFLQIPSPLEQSPSPIESIPSAQGNLETPISQKKDNDRENLAEKLEERRLQLMELRKRRIEMEKKRMLR
ncbi:hypothetical protein GEMRC1_006122 [Eukaryota sp. GEM-RC1]